MFSSIARDIAKLGWPVLIGQLAVMINGVIDTVMSGRLSPEDLAAVGIGASIYISVFVTLMGVLIALSPVVAQLYGARRFEAIGEEVRQSMWLGIFLTSVAFVLIYFPDPFLALAQVRPEVEVKTRAYLKTIAYGVPAMLMFRVFYSFSTAVVAAARDHGAQPARPCAQDPAQPRVHARLPRRPGAWRSRLRLVDDRHCVDHRAGRLGDLLVRQRLHALRRVRALVVAQLGRAAAPPAHRPAHRLHVPRGRDLVHLHGALHRAPGHGQLGRPPDRRQFRGALLHDPAGDVECGGRAGRPGHRRARPCACKAHGPHGASAPARGLPPAWAS